MARSFLQVSFVDAAGLQVASRIFTTKAAAVRFAKWVATQAWASDVKVYRGGVGGDLVFCSEG